MRSSRSFMSYWTSRSLRDLYAVAAAPVARPMSAVMNAISTRDRLSARGDLGATAARQGSWLWSGDLAREAVVRKRDRVAAMRVAIGIGDLAARDDQIAQDDPRIVRARRTLGALGPARAGPRRLELVRRSLRLPVEAWQLGE